MKIEDLQTFHEVIVSGSFTKAAVKLHCTQSTASLRIKRVEDWFGARLLNRSRDTRQEVTLTSAGERILPKIVAALTQMDAAYAALAAERRIENVQIAVVASHTPGLFILPGVLAEFARLYPRVTVNTHVRYTREVIEAVRHDASGTCFGIVSQPEGFEHADLVAQAVMDDPLSIVTGPGAGPRKHVGRASPIRWLQEQTLYMTNQSSSMLTYLRKGCGLELRDIRVVGSVESVKAALLKGPGFAVLSRRAVQDEIAQEKLHECHIPGFSPKRTIYALWAKDLEPSETARAFIRIMSGF